MEREATFEGLEVLLEVDHGGPPALVPRQLLLPSQLVGGESHRINM